MKRTFQVAVVLVLSVFVGLVQADDKSDKQPAKQQKADKPKSKEQGQPAVQLPGEKATFEAKREWLHKNVIRRQRDPRARRTYKEQLSRMDEAQVDKLIKHYQQQLTQSASRSKRQLSEAEKAAAIQQYRQRLAARRNGFAPVITWLPSGTSLNAGAVVSPDGRYVRMSLNPFFSSVPYYDTFNFNNGQTQRYYLDRRSPTSGAAPRRSSAPQRPVPSWYRRVRSR